MSGNGSRYGRDILIVSDVDGQGRVVADISMRRTGDIEIVEGRELMVQAIRNRLLTRKGELAPLGHPEYGSLLEDIIGEANTPDTHRVMEILVRDCLRYESRIRNIVSVTAIPSTENRDEVFISVHVELAPEGEELKITYPLYLEA